MFGLFTWQGCISQVWEVEWLQILIQYMTAFLRAWMIWEENDAFHCHMARESSYGTNPYEALHFLRNHRLSVIPKVARFWSFAFFFFKDWLLTYCLGWTLAFSYLKQRLSSLLGKWVLVSVLSPLLQTGVCMLCLLFPRPCPMTFTPDDSS